MTHALVLAAGLGTRLRPLTDVCAKPAIPVAGEPIIRRIVGWLAAHGVNDLVVNLHHLPHTVTAVLGDGSDLAVRVRYSWEQPRILGSAGGPRHALEIIGEDTFVVVNGDTLTDLNLRALVDAHRGHCGNAGSGALVTLALVPNRQPHKYGGVTHGGRWNGDRVSSRAARAASGTHHGIYHFIGVQVVHADAFRQLPSGEPAQSIGGVYDRAASPPAADRSADSSPTRRSGTSARPRIYARTSAEFEEREKGVGSLFRSGSAKKTPDPFSE